MLDGVLAGAVGRWGRGLTGPLMEARGVSPISSALSLLARDAAWAFHGRLGAGPVADVELLKLEPGVN